MKYKIYLLVIGLGLMNIVSSQNYASFNSYWEPITQSIQTENYFEAYDLIKKALEYKKMTDTLHQLAAESALKLNAYGRSEAHLRQILNTAYGERHPELYKMLGEIMMITGRYGESSNSYKSYLPNANENEVQFINQRILQASWAKENNNNKDPLVKIKKLELGVNTADNEFGPVLHKNSLYYSSLKKNENRSKKDDYYQSKIYRIDPTTGAKQKLDTGLFEANVSAGNSSFANNIFLYNVCQQIEGSTKLNCKVYLKKFDKGKWSIGRLLPEQVNLAGYSSTQANIVEEGELYRIYYSSNRPEGKGGYDIWTTLYNEDGSCSVPENLDYINTQGNEHSPYYSTKSKSLFFSSDYHLGFGGLDLFKYCWKGKDSLQILNLGRSVNSSYDELSFSCKWDESIAYVSSTRPGSEYVDKNLQACCYDLYKVAFTPRSVDLVIRVRDGYDSLDINGSKLMLYDITEQDTLISMVSLPDKAIHTFTLTEGHKYKIVCNKSKYIGDSAIISTLDLYSLDPIKKDLYITQGKDLDITTFERTTNFALKGVTVEVWDLDRNTRIGLLTKSATNNFNFPIYKGRNYRIIASKAKYESDTVEILASKTALENPIQRKMFLELSAIAELRKLLPIRLFFDNDMPNPRSESDTTDVLFSKIYNDYTSKKGVYMYQYANVLKGVAKAKAILEIDTFFDKEVKWNGDKLLIFLDKLSIIMEEGHSIDIFLKGYASPRAKSEYNQHLSSRRVTSIRNEFDYFNKGLFHPYIKSESLKIKEIPFGESKSSSDVSDSLEDTRNSIYNLKAAFERRVEILEILKGVDDDQESN